MTTRIPLLLAALLAPQIAPAQETPPPEMAPQVKRDLVRAVRIMAASSAAYARLRSYSGRFEIRGRFLERASGEMRWERPNRLSMSVKARGRGGAYSRRAVSDGRFFYISDSRLSDNFVKRPIPKGPSAIGDMIGAVYGMDFARTMSEPDRFKMTGPVSQAPWIGSSMLAPTTQRRYQISITDGATVEIRTRHSSGFKETFRYGPDKLLRQIVLEYPAPQPLRVREWERHWEVRPNPRLPATIFEWKPAAGARQVSSQEFEALRSR